MKKRENEKKPKVISNSTAKVTLVNWGIFGGFSLPSPTPLLTCHRFLQVKFVGQWIWTWSSRYRLPAAFYVPCSWSCSYLLWDRLFHGGLQGAVNFTAEKNLFDYILSSHSDSLLATGVIEKLFVSDLSKALVCLFKIHFPCHSYSPLKSRLYLDVCTCAVYHSSHQPHGRLHFQLRMLKVCFLAAQSYSGCLVAWCGSGSARSAQVHLLVVSISACFCLGFRIMLSGASFAKF